LGEELGEGPSEPEEEVDEGPSEPDEESNEVSEIIRLFIRL
jgi:hypothetical protein